MTRGDGVLLIWNDIAPGMEGAFRGWHSGEHMPERIGVPGFLAGRRFFASDATPRWLTLYEARDAEVFSSPDYLARLNAPTPRTRAMLPYFRGTERMAGRVIGRTGAGHGDAVLTTRVWLQGQPPPDPAAIQRLVEALAVDALSAAAVHTDAAATGVTTAEQSLRQSDHTPPDLVFIVEGRAAGTVSRPGQFDALFGTAHRQLDWFELEAACFAP